MVADSERGLAADRVAIEQSVRSLLWAFIAGAGIGVLGGMIGLGGAEFRLPLLIGVFGFAALSAVILNKAMSLIVVITALPARLFAVPWSSVAPYWFVVANLLAGSLVGAWLGATWATRMRSATHYRVLAVLLVLIAGALAWSHFGATGGVDLPTPWRIVAGVIAGAGIGVVASLMGVAGGELLIPTIVLLYGVDIKIAGTLSMAVPLPTMLVAFARYSRDASFQVLRGNKWFVLVMASGSIVGTLLGGLLSDNDREALAALIRPGWREAAACAGTAVHRWFVDDRQAIETAITVCRSCPVRLACLANALVDDELGIWGGTTDADRDQIRYDLSLGVNP